MQHTTHGRIDLTLNGTNQAALQLRQPVRRLGQPPQTPDGELHRPVVYFSEVQRTKATPTTLPTHPQPHHAYRYTYVDGPDLSYDAHSCEQMVLEHEAH